MSTHNIGFYEDIAKLSLNYHQISSNTHLISSAAFFLVFFLIVECYCDSLVHHVLLCVSHFSVDIFKMYSFC